MTYNIKRLMSQADDKKSYNNTEVTFDTLSCA